MEICTEFGYCNNFATNWTVNDHRITFPFINRLIIGKTSFPLNIFPNGSDVIYYCRDLLKVA